ncbi:MULTISPECIES: hypothetical protein [Sphingobacterium]|uniref:hypothetical protein n=1 Tax=Sphingobacterium TaxID=28453 RepID=UPI001AE926DD|nr:hypothetical protein [Sphingobacterium sp. 2149]MDR6734985.1 hypothetical protein [Sphingobacterium sp. 2149]
MCKIIILFTFLAVSAFQLISNCFAQTKYVVFDQDKLTDSLNGHLFCKRTYAEIGSDSTNFPNLTIYNFLFKKSIIPDDSNQKVFQNFISFEREGKDLPVDILVTLTPLTRSKFEVKNISKAIINKDINLISLDSLLRTTAKDIFYATYAPLGIFSETPSLNLKRTDYKIVIKRKNEYFLVDNETLTESYFIGKGNMEPYRINAAGIYLQSRSFSKQSYLSTGRLNTLKGGIIKDTTINLNNQGRTIMIDRFWTNEPHIPFTKSAGLNKGSDWYAVEGIGDFEFYWDNGILNGNFLDYFKRAQLIYMPDKQLNRKLNLWYKTKKINGIPFEAFFKDKGLDNTNLKAIL